MDLQSLFDQGMSCAERGEYREAIQAYQRFLDAVRDPGTGLPSSERASLIRAAAFNLAQVFNKTKQYEEALRLIELGVSGTERPPTDYGWAIAMSAKGEALCGLGRTEEGLRCFDQAATFHPVVGRLNSADGMTRLNEAKFWDLGEKRVQVVLASFQHMLNQDLRAEAATILGKVAARRGAVAEARRQFEAALRDHPTFEDAKLQLRQLELRPSIVPAPTLKKRVGLFQRIFGSR